MREWLSSVVPTAAYSALGTVHGTRSLSVKESTSISAKNTPATNAPAHLPRWVVATLEVPLIGKIAGANAIIVAAAVGVAVIGGMVGQGSQLWVILLIALGLGL